MDKVLGAFLNRRQIRITIRILVLLLATFNTCNPAPPHTECMRARARSRVRCLRRARAK